jgi:hypothetical protein
VWIVRYGLPVAILVAGVVLLVLGGDANTGAGIVLIGVAALVVVANLFIRLGLASEEDRAREEERRRRL